MNKVLIVGDGSYLAENIEKNIEAEIDRIHYYDDIDLNEYPNYDYVINFGIQRDFSKRLLDTKELIDVQIANVLEGTDTKLIMLSSRKVYGSSDELKKYKESDDLFYTDFYSQNKINTENELKKILPDRLVIARIANIIGFPTNRIGYKTFIGWISESIKRNSQLFVTENPNTRKDFISKDYFQKAINEIIRNNINGEINIGSGFTITLKELLEHICGRENIIYAENLPNPRDQFVLDSEKLNNIGSFFTYEDLLKICDENKKLLFTDKI